MGTILLCGLALGLALQVAIHLRIAAIPVRAVERLKREIEARARADTKRVDELVTGLAAAADQVRACAAELRKIQSDGVELLIEQRAYAGELQVLARFAAQQRVSAVPRAPSPEDDQRATVEMPRPAAAPPPALDVDEDEPEDEQTQVASRPIAGTPAAPNGLGLASRTAIPPPPPASRRGSER